MLGNYSIKLDSASKIILDQRVKKTASVVFPDAWYPVLAFYINSLSFFAQTKLWVCKTAQAYISLCR